MYELRDEVLWELNLTERVPSTAVVYFEQSLGAGQSKSWLKYSFSTFLKKAEKRKKKQKNWYKIVVYVNQPTDALYAVRWKKYFVSPLIQVFS